MFESCLRHQMNKQCSRCKEVKDISSFYKAKQMKDGHQSSCKVCNDLRTKASRDAKPDKYRERRKELRGEYSARYIEWKALQKCLLCDESDSCCLDLHHLDPSEKEGSVSMMVAGRTWENLMKEITKCVVVCRNCHAKIHAGLITLL